MTERFSYRIPMHHEGHLVTLGEILDVIDGKGLEWRLTDFEAIAVPDFGLDILSIERAVSGTRGGLIFSFNALLEFAQGLDQVINCEILGYATDVPRIPGEAVVIVQALDSTEWILKADDPRARLDLGSSLLHG
jgi:hypothetical protein